VVGSQTASLIPGPSFGHNLCFRCSNEKCEPILDIYVPRSFQWYKELHNLLSFDPWNRSLKFWKFIGTSSPKVGVALGVWGFTPSHFPTFSKAWDVSPGLPLGPQPCNPSCLGRKPKARVVTMLVAHDFVTANQWNRVLWFQNTYIKMKFQFGDFVLWLG
jgi:hypothetical protein